MPLPYLVGAPSSVLKKRGAGGNAKVVRPGITTWLLGFYWLMSTVVLHLITQLRGYL